jgi:hypothetical protein
MLQPVRADDRRVRSASAGAGWVRAARVARARDAMLGKRYVEAHRCAWR